MSPPEQRVPVPPAAHYADEQYYYFSEQVYTNDAGAYARELRLDDDQALSQAPPYTSSPNAHQYDQPADHGEDRSHSPAHKRHLAEGTLACAGTAALIANHRIQVGEEHRGRNVVGGAALGAIGAEVSTRARSRYREDRRRSRSLLNLPVRENLPPLRLPDEIYIPGSSHTQDNSPWYLSASSSSSAASGEDLSDEKRIKKMKGRQLLTAGLPTIATVNAVHNIYQCMEKREARHKAVQEGEMTPEETRKLKAKAKFKMWLLLKLRR